MRVHQPDGTEVFSTFEVRAGVVHVHCQAEAVTLTPADIRKLQKVLKDAQAAAFYQRGEW